jgi:enediyne biosynthesis thioesterase
MYYEWRHIVTFEETNLVGNVYYANHIRWQGSCREIFLKEHAPEVLEQFSKDLVMVTTRVSCEYFDELFVFDEVILQMRAGSITSSRIVMLFDYLRQETQGEELIARGEQQVACLLKGHWAMVPAPIPKSLQEALTPYLSN